MLLASTLALAASRPAPHRLDAGSNPATASLLETIVDPDSGDVLSDAFKSNPDATVPAGRNDIGMLTNILWTRDDEWETIEKNFRIVNPRFSSIAIDMFDRPDGETPEEARKKVLAKHGDVIALFDRVNYFTTGNKTGVDKHVKSSITYRRHWQAVLGDTDPMATKGAYGGLHGEGLPELFMQVDSRYKIESAVINNLGSIKKTLRASVAARAAIPDQLAARKASATWWKSMWLDRTSNLPCGWGTTRNETTQSAALKSAAGGCTVSPKTQHPVFLAPLTEYDMRDMPLFRNLSCDECAAVPATTSSFGAIMDVSVRFPYCPSSQKFIFHRSDLPLYLEMLTRWREAFDMHYPSGEEFGIFRAETIGCGLLSKYETTVYAFYPSDFGTPLSDAEAK